MLKSFPFFAVLLVLTFRRSLSTDEITPCEPSGQSLKFSVTGRRNQTGHWNAKVRMDPDVNDKRNEETLQSGPWKADVELSAGTCNDIQNVFLTVSVTAPPVFLGNGYSFYPGVGYYKHHTILKNWEEARKSCIKEGSHLAIINSEAESGILQSLLAKLSESNKHAFVGFHDQYKEGQYLTVFGEPLSTTGFYRWAPGQPDNYGGNSTSGGEDCGSIYRDGGMNDIACLAKVTFFCEHELW